jgi:hypothetical protein
VNWAWLYQPAAADWKRGANLMVARSERAIPADSQGVLFYLYAADLIALRNRLLSAGLQVGEIRHPDYLPQGECRMADPDGYCLMIAQSGPDTP